uniref:Histone-lysine N-methyltransferase SMYD3-like n=1 Tax=Dermatophagoides pteronyssinus TaxID=6956 RepID=A0A6P6Y8M0_DERPT|nr:histone-lysine N-methyltransferase SMYD3-like [Dermatophagoides pteronyssinus]
MYYCGIDCQKKDWIQHKLECKIYKENFDQLNLTGLQEDLLFRLMLRLNMFLKDKPFRLWEHRKFLNDENSFVCLIDIKNQKPPTFHRKKFFHFLSMGQQSNSRNIDWTIKMLCRDICYDYGLNIFNYELQPLGLGLYLAESQLKHSCSPDVSILFNGTQLVMRTTRPIKSGEQITVNFFKFINETIPFKSGPVSMILPTLPHPCDECVSKTSMIKKELNEMYEKAMSSYLNKIFEFPIFKKYLSFISQYCNECDFGLLLLKIIILENYALDNDVEELSVVELAKNLEITLPSVYNEIFKNIYFDREEVAHVSLMKALANVEFNVEN